MRKLRLFMVILLATAGMSSIVHAEARSEDRTAVHVSDHAKEAVSSPVNVNTADVTELSKIKGVGFKKADAIVQYRTQHGPFKSVDDVANVKGVGQKRLEKIKGQLAVS